MAKFLVSHTVTDMPAQNNFYKHCHNDYELFFFVKGDADFVVEGLKYKLVPYTMLFIRPAQYHYLHLNSHLPYDRFVSNFRENDVPQEIYSRVESLSPCYYLKAGDEAVRLYFKLIKYKEIYTPEDYSLLARQILSEILLSLIYKEGSAGKMQSTGPESGDNDPTPTDPIVIKTVEFINKNLTAILDLDIIADAIFVSKSYLSHVFNKHMKTGVMRYVKHKKILFAQSLLQKGVSPTEASQICGFSDYSTFYRLYKDILKTIPSKAFK